MEVGPVVTGVLEWRRGTSKDVVKDGVGSNRGRARDYGSRSSNRVEVVDETSTRGSSGSGSSKTRGRPTLLLPGLSEECRGRCCLRTIRDTYIR
jgi:hypothetical protein